MNLCLILPAHKGMVESIHQPLGLIVLRSAIKKAIKNIHVDILDGVKVNSKLINEIACNYEMAGIHINSFNVLNCISLGKGLKQRGLKVLIGGPEVTISNDLSWANGIYDIAVKGQVSSNILREFRNLTISKNFTPKVMIGGVTYSEPIDYSDLDFSTYWQRGAALDYKRNHIPIITHFGCTFREKTKGGCSFCADTKTPPSLRSGEVISKELWNIFHTYRIKNFYCVGENLSKEIFYYLSKNVNPPPNSTWSFFIRADEVDINFANEMIAFGIHEVRMGVESCNSHILAATRKRESLKTIENAINILNNNEIIITASFILGLPGESEISLKRTVKTVERWAIQHTNFRFSTSIVVPVPGSAIAKLAGTNVGVGLTLDDQKQFISKNTTVSFEQILNAYQRLSSNSKSIHSSLSTVTTVNPDYDKFCFKNGSPPNKKMHPTKAASTFRMASLSCGFCG